MSNLLVDFVKSAGQFLSQPSQDQLVIRRTSAGHHSFSTASPAQSIYQTIASYFSYPSLDESTTGSLQNLREIIGDRRLERIFAKKDLGLSLEALHLNQVRLTQEVVHKIFIGLADVQAEDLKEAAKKQNKSLKQMSIQEIDELYHELFPLQEVKEIFTKYCQSVYYVDKAKTSGKGFKGLQERVWTILTAKERYRTHQLIDPVAIQLSEIEMLTSRLSDREPPVGTVIRLHDGYFKVKKVFASGGAYVTILSEISATNAQPRTLLLCRGTAMRPTATGGYQSGMNDVLIDMGLRGVMSVWPDLKAYLETKKIQNIEVFGKSLGGAHAQFFATLIAGKTSTEVKSLATCGSLGAANAQKIFEDILKKKRESHLSDPSVVILRNSGNEAKKQVDHIPLAGGVHVHSSNTKVYYVFPEGESISPIAEIQNYQDALDKVKKFAGSLGYAHVCQVTQQDSFQYWESPDIERETNLGTYLESIRKPAVKIIDFLINNRTFEDFYYSQAS